MLMNLKGIKLMPFVFYVSISKKSAVKIDRTFVLLNIVKMRNVILHSHYSLWYRGCKHLDSQLLLRMPE